LDNLRLVRRHCDILINADLDTWWLFPALLPNEFDPTTTFMGQPKLVLTVGQSVRHTLGGALQCEFSSSGLEWYELGWLLDSLTDRLPLTQIMLQEW